MAKKELDRFEVNPKKDMQIKTKLLSIIALAIFGATASVAALCILLSGRFVKQDIRDTLEAAGDGAIATTEDWAASTKQYAYLLTNNQEMIVNYREDLEGTVTTSAPGIMGEGITMAETVGAGLVDIDQIQLHPTVEQKTSMLITFVKHCAVTVKLLSNPLV